MGTGYSGLAEGKNNPAMERIHDVGPIPRGSYTIGPEFQSEKHGPVVHKLAPNDGTDALVGALVKTESVVVDVMV